MLPAPNLDDRTFQGLVDEAKRLVQNRCPEWTDHNVSDPGVTLIEAFAQMVDQLIYRLNRVPDLNYIKFLELIGVELRSPAPAQGKVTFWLSAPQPQTVLVRNETQVATPRTDIHEPIVFSTTRDLEIIPCAFARAGAWLVGSEPTDHTQALSAKQGFPAFSATPGARRRPADRAHGGCPVLRGHLADGLHGGRCRRRPAAAAADLGGLDGQRLDALRARPRRHRRSQRGRRRRAARPRRPPDLDHRP